MTKKNIALFLILVFLFESIALAGIGGKQSAYIGGTIPNFKNAKDPVVGELKTEDDNKLEFVYGKEKSVVAIPYKNIIDLEYGQKAGRRVGAATATALLVSPIGLALLFSKKRKHFLTIGYTDGEGKEQAAVFELGKDVVRVTLKVVETRSGKKLTYQDEESKQGQK